MKDIAKNSRITFKVRDVSIDGSGIGTCEENGMTVFCFGAEKGETVTATVIKKTSGYMVAKKDDRPASPLCSVYPLCGGCSLLHLSYERTLEIKQNHVRDCLERIGGLKDLRIDPIIPSPDISGFRNKAIYRFVASKDGIGCGFFRRNSHDVVVSETCICEKSLCRVICSAMLEILNSGGYSVYDEKTGKGLLRALMVRVSLENKAMVCLSVNASAFPEANDIARKLIDRVPSVASFFINFNTAETNTVFSGDFKHILGRETLRDRIGEAEFEIAPESFFQVNPGATVKLYDKAFDYAVSGSDGPLTLLDVYCGIGTIGVYFARKNQDKFKSIFGVEYTEAAVKGAVRAAEENNISASCRYVSGDAGKVLSEFRKLPADIRETVESGNVAVVDPPRKGLDEKIPGVLSSLPLSKIVYVSCNPATLARDLVRFKALGWQATAVTPVDMFPFEGHVEVVSLLQRMSNTLKKTITLDVDMEDYHRIKSEGR